MKLTRYKSKRDLKTSREPIAKIKKKKGKELIFVIQEHHARNLHYDLRLEADGVLKSWAIPKQPSMDPTVKRLAIMVEDHPYDYKDFEGTIPSGYGAGTVKIWDKGTLSIEGKDAKESEKHILQGIKKGAFHFTLKGKKLKGAFLLVHLKKFGKSQWLFMKKKSNETASTNPNKFYWPKEKITKSDLLNYYEEISPWILSYLKDRPESLRRHPDGIEGETFYQKNLVTHPAWIKTAKIKHENKDVNYLLIQDTKSLLYAANLGCIEMHPFFSRVGKLDKPDFLMLDLDPKDAPFSKVIEVAQAIHELLEEIGVPSYPKTSGATGLHIAIPLGAKYSYKQAKPLAELIAKLIQSRLPKIATLERSLAKRRGRVYIDYHQNNFAQTLASVYCVRAKPGAPVSTPLHWKEVKKGLDPKDFTIKTIFKRLKKVGDLFAPVLKRGINLSAALKKLSALTI